MIATIHTLKSRVGLDDDSYRDLLRQQTGLTSAKALSVLQAGRVIDRLRDLAGDAGSAKGAVVGLDTPIGGKLRALWIAGYDLAIVRDRTDRAMLGFLERQTGVSHVRFLSQPRDGTAAVEGLKAWLARDGNVAWPPKSDDVIGAKRAVLEAQWMKLVELRAVRPFAPHQPLGDLDSYAYRVAGKTGWGALDARDLDDVQNALGRKLRGFIAKYPDLAADRLNQDQDHG